MSAQADFSRPGLVRYRVGTKEAEAKAMVELMHECAALLRTPDVHSKAQAVAPFIEKAAVMLDECRAGWNLFHPQPHSGWVLVPATVIPKVGAAVEALIALLERPELEYFPATDAEGDALLESARSAIDGGRAVLRMVLRSLKGEWA